MLSWRMGRTPPAHLETEEEKKNWATTASIARFWVMTVAIKKSRISANRLKVRTQNTAERRLDTLTAQTHSQHRHTPLRPCHYNHDKLGAHATSLPCPALVAVKQLAVVRDSC